MRTAIDNKITRFNIFFKKYYDFASSAILFKALPALNQPICPSLKV